MTMHRRTFLLGAALVAVPARAAAQAARTVRVGWISRAPQNDALDALRDGLRDLGYVEGRNLVLDTRWGDNASNERMEQMAADLVRRKPDVIVTQGPGVRFVASTGTTIPVVFGFSGDPVVGGFIDSLARPGRNMTGMSFLALELVGKRLEVLRELMPAVRRVAILANPQHAGERREFEASEAAARTLGIAVEYFQHQPGLTREQALDVLDKALAGIRKSRSEAMVVFPDASTMQLAERIAAFSVDARIPAVSGWSEFVTRGNVASYGPVLKDGFRRLASFVDRIVKGAKPSELPVELPTNVELVLNRRTAKALALTIPPALVLRANQIID
jgi:putative tryptophan/tyrosine transport system substrate-binding protein